MTDLTVALKLLLDSRGFVQGLGGSGRGVQNFASGAKKELGSLNQTIRGVRNQIIGLGIGFGALGQLKQSAGLDRLLTQIGQTAGASRREVVGLRTEIFALARDSGNSVDSLVGGFNNLVQSGQTFKQALATIKAINPASAVTGASPDVLAGGLTVAAKTFDFDLSDVKVGKLLLDQLVVAGRAGNAELEDLAGIFARVGVNAKTANLNFPSTLAFIEGLSQVERSPERLATLSESTLRLFTNNKYKAAAQSATKVPFYNKDGSGRDPLDVLDDISAKFKTLRTDKSRDRFIAKGFGNTDLDTQRGIKTLLGGDFLSLIRGYKKDIVGAGGTVDQDKQEALNNADVQTKRLASSLREVADKLSTPINATVADFLQKVLNPKSEGGLGLNTTGVAAVTGASILGAGVLGYAGRKLLNKIPLIGGAFGDAAGLAAGVGQGKALEKLAGVTPVFVTNFPGDGGGGSGLADAAGGAATALGAGKILKGAPALLRLLRVASLSEVGSGFALGTGALGGGATIAGGVGAAALAGYGFGSYLNKGTFFSPAIEGTGFSNAIGRAIAVALASVGSSNARDALTAERKQQVSGTIKVELVNGQLRVGNGTRGNNVDFDFSSGPLALSN